MRTVLHRLGFLSAAHPWRVLLGWVAALAVAAGLATASGGQTQENWDVPDARAQQGVELLRAHGENAANADARCRSEGSATNPAHRHHARPGDALRMGGLGA